ncbi:Hypothetical protein I595_924 [Croceitalea dokdonensis DOKDO 023]|uniref:Uncharacterized protein n=1 Tax=Croceitalea dokdonensis DOKDO 023 TaxID=1300341 RepID=A0A0P7B2K5_9FLAO|nr:hypothetical protein [Croceitalea dokdonensis]KPM32506.1 Hypothetical protein I595_924 [Croceitalea dokdonensis DOKDO 023]
MKKPIRNALYGAAALLLASALASQFNAGKQVWTIFMVASSVVAIIWGVKEDRKLYGCLKKRRKSKSKL